MKHAIPKTLMTFQWRHNWLCIKDQIKAFELLIEINHNRKSSMRRRLCVDDVNFWYSFWVMSLTWNETFDLNWYFDLLWIIWLKFTPYLWFSFGTFHTVSTQSHAGKILFYSIFSYILLVFCNISRLRTFGLSSKFLLGTNCYFSQTLWYF